MSRMKPLPDRPELTRLIAESVAKFNAMSPAEQADHLKAQRISWCIGELMLSHPEMSREEAERVCKEPSDDPR